ncbi:Hypothetical protein R9X50_00689500 [Acrodontium crateriforme]|uniref:Uncharacterized protein n=1 Tax=Acrodontium crateriforme TaxID=150365 RepID=A0AAQ3R753_9PEZI|nr:Hypothetical protein R9X50_00689500 [Acrodontium crateriforme]
MVQKPSGPDAGSVSSVNGDHHPSVNTSDLPDGLAPSIHSSPHPSIVESFLSNDDAKSSLHGSSIHGDETKEPSIDGSSGNLRSASSKFANLRAAFEKGPANEANASPGKRSFSARSPSPRVASGRWHDHESELRKLRSELDKERELRIAQEDKSAQLTREAEQLRKQLQDGTNETPKPADSTPNTPKKENVGDLQRQLSEMKRNISRSTRMESQVADSTFVREIGVLHYEIQNWVVNNFRRSKTDMTAEQMVTRLESVAEPEQMERLRKLYEAWDPSARLSIYQATAMSFIMEIFAENLLFGLPSQEPWRKSLRRTAETLPAVLTPESYNKWRSITLDEIRQSPQIKQPIDIAASGMTEIICLTLSVITETDMNESMKTSLKTIILRVISLAHLFRVQRPQYDFDLPTPNTLFDAASMEDIELESDITNGHNIRCATFPTIYKIGDEHGHHTHLRNVIVKAKVLCNEA